MTECGYRESPIRQVRPGRGGWRGWLCRLVGHSWFVFYSPRAAQTHEDMPRMCLRCSAINTGCETIEGMGEAVERFCRRMP